jgi:hypothetical protein
LRRRRAKPKARRLQTSRAPKRIIPRQPDARVARPTSLIAPDIIIAAGSRGRQHPFIVPPSDFSLRSNYDGVASFFSHLRSRVYNDVIFSRQSFGIEFAALQSISPSGALMLAAELHRMQRFLGISLSAVRQNEWNPTVRKLLHELGLFDLLATPNIDSSAHAAQRSDGIEILKFSVDTEVTGSKCGYLLDRLSKIAGSIPAENFIYDGLIEALKNSKHHAYSEPGQWFGVQPGTWFMTGSYDSVEKKLTASVFDLGVGIPHTLPRSGIWEHLRPIVSLGLAQDDGKMIAAAMEYGRTRTSLKERGKGLPIMMRLLDHHQGYLRIVSGKGEARYDSLTQTIQETSHRESIGGTLIEWSVQQ